MQKHILELKKDQFLFAKRQIFSHRLLYIDINAKREKGLKQKNEKVQKVLALLLVFVMVFTTAGMNVAAAGEMEFCCRRSRYDNHRSNSRFR